MSEYGDIDSFDYNFSYQLMWTAFDLPTYEGAAGLPLSARLTVGTSSNKDNFVSTEPQAWADGKADLGEPFFHSGTTTFLKSVDGNIAYIPITLDFSFATERKSSFWYFVSQAFKITTPTQSSTLSSSGLGSTIRASSPTSSSSISSSFTRRLSSEVIPRPSGNGVPVSLPSTPGLTRRTSAGMIAGVVVGVLFLLGTIVLVLFLLLKRKQGSLWQIVQGYSVRKATTSSNLQKGSNIVSTT
ncbi:hypothetical protein FRC19_006080, partial [Serendipita sp. 401]